MVFTLVLSLILTHLCFSGQYTFLSCRLTCCSFLFRLWEKVTL